MIRNIHASKLYILHVHYSIFHVSYINMLTNIMINNQFPLNCTYITCTLINHNSVPLSCVQNGSQNIPLDPTFSKHTLYTYQLQTYELYLSCNLYYQEQFKRNNCDGNPFRRVLSIPNVSLCLILAGFAGSALLALM